MEKDLEKFGKNDDNDEIKKNDDGFNVHLD